jgi:Ca2+-binding RTX toxin-like protein
VADQTWQVAGIGDFNGDRHDDILWRNGATGENYVYLMNGRALIGEGYIRPVADQNWQVAGVGDFDGDLKADLLWRNSATGENYVYLMDGTTIKPSEGYLRTVADQNWQVAGIGDLNGDGRSDIVWRNAATGEDYVYLMNGRAISDEGYLRTVADQSWQIKAVGDYDGDGKADLFWRNGATGENYVYLMDGKSIKPGEGPVRTVADTNWDLPGHASYGRDSIDGGAGSDTLDFSSTQKSAIVVNLQTGTLIGGDEGGSGRATLTGIENVTAKATSSYADRITGSDAANRLAGGGGNDTLTGGAGADSFVFAEAGTANADRITDFAPGADKVALDDAGFAAIGNLGDFAAGDARFYAAAGASSGHDGDDRVIYDTSTGQLYYDADGNGTGTAQLIATLTNIPAISATDLTVI